MRYLPIRLRLTLWYVLMFASAAALLCVASLWMLQRSVDVTEYHGLQERADDVRVVLSHEPSTRSLTDVSADFAAMYTSKDDGKYLQVRDEQGRWIYRSQRMIAANPELVPPAELPMGGQIAEFRQGVHRVRILSYPIMAQGTNYSVQTGISLNKSIILLRSFRGNLLLLTPIVIVLAGLSGHMMSRKALSPVTALATEARRIHDRNLDTRLPVPNARDEIYDLAETLNQMLERIDRAFASVRAFTGNASHELRTPIALMRTEIEVALYRSRDPEEYRATLGRLQDETVRMTNLVESLLSLARADGGADTSMRVPIRVNMLLDHMQDRWKCVMEQAMLDFQITAAADDLAVLGDVHAISRLLSILLENAAKYTPPGGSVKLGAEVVGASILLSVRDSGIGIGPEHKRHIFDRFYRATPSDFPVSSGSGLGLSLAQWIAERHGTEVSVESAPGCGSCFSFSLEMADPDCRDMSSRNSEHFHLVKGRSLKL